VSLTLSRLFTFCCLHETDLRFSSQLVYIVPVMDSVRKNNHILIKCLFYDKRAVRVSSID